MSNINTEECCPKFNPEPWDDKVFTWENRRFIKDKVFTLFYMPINFGKVIVKLDELVTKSGAKIVDWICLSEYTSKWNMDIYLGVDKEVIGANNVNMSGNYYSKVYEGPFKNTSIWIKDFNETLNAKGYTSKRLFMWYTTCPKCSKKYGKNYTVIVAQID